MTDATETTDSTKVQKKVRVIEAAGSSIDADDYLYKPLTGDNKRDLSAMNQQRMQKLATYLWESNPLADRLIELPVAFILGDGIRLTHPDPDCQELLDNFWKDPINRMDLTIEDKVRELAIFGEQCYPTFVNEHDGHVRLGGLDPANIATIVQDPDNSLIPIGVVTVKDKKGIRKKYRIIINADEDVFTERTQRIREQEFSDGDCFYFRIRGLSNGGRGRSDLLPSMDWLDGYDQFLFGELDRVDQLRAFLWDVMITGASQEECEQRARDLVVPKSGGTRVHNESEVWQALSPDLNAQDTTESARLFRNHILGGSTLPEHWFGGGGDVNRSTAGEMDEPTFKILGQRQRRVRSILIEMGKYQLRQAGIAQGKTAWVEAADDVACEVPEMVNRDTTKYASALQQVAGAIVALMNATLITKEFAIKLITQSAKNLGVECDAEDLLDSIAEQAAADEEDDLPTEEDLAVDE
ncbi:MAG: hypothetical protein DHS20C12_11880 [Pseudohongiella sp.]|nr:MAG: hypothetical protein DHS20C12_11880 [Pseudohongiella sp.]